MYIAVGDPLTAYSLARTGSAPGPVMLDALTLWSWAFPLGLLGTYMVMLFPDGRLPSRRWRPLAWLSGAAILLVSVALTVEPGPLPNRGGVRNPLGIEGYPWIKAVARHASCCWPCAYSPRPLASSGVTGTPDRETREQIKWLAFAASFMGVMYVSPWSAACSSCRSLFSQSRTPIWFSLILDLVLLSFAGIPTAIGFAVLKYRLYDIDIIINRALVYGPLTISLAAVYLGGVVGTQAAFRTLTGQEQQPQFAVVVSTLAIAALFNPLRRRIQSFIDRRFYRRKYRRFP